MAYLHPLAQREPITAQQDETAERGHLLAVDALLAECASDGFALRDQQVESTAPAAPPLTSLASLGGPPRFLAALRTRDEPLSCSGPSGRLR